MDLALFKQRYPSFTDDVAIQLALDEAELLISMFNIDEDKIQAAIGYMAAHLLTLQPTNGATEQKVLKVKADTVEVQFSDKGVDGGWLGLSSYGRLLMILIKPDERKVTYGVIKDCHPSAIKFDDRVDFDGTIIQGRQDDKRFNQ